MIFQKLLVRFALIVAIVFVAGAWSSPVWAAENETQPKETQQQETQRVATARLTPEVRAAIQRGLEYLAKPGVQNPDGSWGDPKQNWVAGKTSLALMAFMIPGHVPGRGRYGSKMDDGISYLINLAQSRQGFIRSPTNDRGMYEHGLAILALSEAWGQSRNPKIRDTLRRAVDITLRAQNNAGGWRYPPEPVNSPDGADVSVTAMQVVALNSAKEAGIAVPEETFERATKYVLSQQDQTSGGFLYPFKNNNLHLMPGFARSAAGVMSLMMTGHRRDQATQRGLAYLKACPDTKYDSKKEWFFYYGHYYAVQAMYQSGDADFQAWYPKIASKLLSIQNSDGSWPQTPEKIGPAYTTSMAILILGVPYRYLPIYQR
jgi:hypothetical protein